jgi:hypothetical protein
MGMGGGNGAATGGKPTKTAKETASNITSGGQRPLTIQLTIGKLQDQIVIHTTNLQMGAKDAAAQVVQALLGELNGMNNALEGS